MSSRRLPYLDRSALTASLARCRKALANQRHAMEPGSGLRSTADHLQTLMADLELLLQAERLKPEQTHRRTGERPEVDRKGLLEELGECRRALCSHSPGMPFQSAVRLTADGLLRLVDDMAGLLTGDPGHFVSGQASAAPTRGGPHVDFGGPKER